VPLADKPEGPYTSKPGRIFEAEGDTGKSWMLAEDPFIWYSTRYGNRYFAVARDAVGRFTGASGGIALFESADGLQWKPADHPKVLGNQFMWADGKASSDKLERPALLLSDGVPTMLFGATDGYQKGGRISFNVHIPLRPQLWDPPRASPRSALSWPSPRPPRPRASGALCLLDATGGPSINGSPLSCPVHPSTDFASRDEAHGAGC